MSRSVNPPKKQLQSAMLLACVSVWVGTSAFAPDGSSEISDSPATDVSSDEVTSDASLSEEVRQDRFQVNKKHLAISGYDPVAYFPEGGEKPTKGKSKFEVEFRGVRYRFANESHMELFRADPARYEPAYGGWCAYAMALDDYTKPSPKRFLIQGDRLMLFYDGLFEDTYKSWQKEDPKKLEELANAFWMSELEAAADRLQD